MEGGEKYISIQEVLVQRGVLGPSTCLRGCLRDCSSQVPPGRSKWLFGPALVLPPRPSELSVSSHRDLSCFRFCFQIGRISSVKSVFCARGCYIFCESGRISSVGRISSSVSSHICFGGPERIQPGRRWPDKLSCGRISSGAGRISSG